jgi:hypothetical protein
LVVRAEDVLRFPVENFARGSESNLAASADAFEEFSFELIFECADLLADRRLRDEVAFCRERKALEVDEIAKDLEG